MLEIDTDRLLADLKTLAEFGRVGTGVHRRALTDIDLKARHWLCAQLREAGLEAHIDGVGSVFGRTPGCEQHILIGSHTDTVPNGGWLDGAMGVLYGLAVARAWMAAGRRGGTGIEVVSFNDEEGRFAGLLGSNVFTRRTDMEAARAYQAADGETLGEALAAAGLADTPVEYLDPRRHRACFEAHIEQGPVLESAGRRIGVVTSIVGVRRVAIRWQGQADHAGTMPMAMRRDAAAALYDFAGRFNAFCRNECSPQTVWNLGDAGISPGAYNVVASEATLLVEYRDSSTEVLDRIRAFIPEAAAEAAAASNTQFSLTPTMDTPPAPMDPTLMQYIEDAASTQGVTALHMPSGAGHDAMLVAPLVPTAMLFVPSIGGRSHDVVEDTSEADIALGAAVLGGAVARLLD